MRGDDGRRWRVVTRHLIREGKGVWSGGDGYGDGGVDEGDGVERWTRKRMLVGGMVMMVIGDGRY